MSALRVPEAFVAWLWQGGASGGPLALDDGRPLRVIYPGRCFGSWGPDFRGALLEIDGGLVHGDVEVHVHPRDWFAHGHAADPAYGQTVLHVVFTAAHALPALRHDGVVVPSVALQPALRNQVEDLLATYQQQASATEPIACRTPEEAAPILERAGMARFADKAARFEGDFAVVDPPQALWTGIFEALGYSANVQPFRRLADRVTYAEACAVQAPDPRQLTALLLGEAGLLPHQRGQFPWDDYTSNLSRLWWALDRYGPTASLGWRIIGVRPGNNPVRRVAGAGALLAREPEALLHKRVLGTLAEVPAARTPTVLRSLVQCPGDEYWTAHSDLGRQLRRPAALIGAARAADIVVNVLLPWAAAVGARADEPMLTGAAEAAYRLHPPLATNEITRHMAQQIVGSAARTAIRTACAQQGLIHIYRGWCDSRDCSFCPAGPPLGGVALRPEARRPAVGNARD